MTLQSFLFFIFYVLHSPPPPPRKKRESFLGPPPSLGPMNSECVSNFWFFYFPFPCIIIFIISGFFYEKEIHNLVKLLVVIAGEEFFTVSKFWSTKVLEIRVMIYNSQEAEERWKKKKEKKEFLGPTNPWICL